jgi:hypothetical protein
LLICLVTPAVVRLLRKTPTTVGLHGPFHKPFEISFAVALSTYYVGPWLSALGARFLQWLPRFTFF